jgi:hypothetical protein
LHPIQANFWIGWSKRARRRQFGPMAGTWGKGLPHGVTVPAQITR